MKNILNSVRTFFTAAPKRDRFFNRHPSLALALFLPAMACAILYGGIHIFRFTSIVTDDNLYADGKGGVVVLEVFPGGASDRAGLKVDDLITAVNGQKVITAKEAMKYIVEGWKGKTLTYTVRRDDQTLDVHIVLASFGIPLLAILMVASAILFFALSAFVMMRRAGLPLARLFSWSLLVLGFLLIITNGYSALYYPDILTRLRLRFIPFTWMLALSSLYHLLLHFPVPRAVRPLPRWFLFIVYLSPFVASILVDMALGMEKRFAPFGVSLGVILVLEIIFHTVFRSLRNPERGAQMRPLRLAGIVTIVALGSLGFVTSYSTWQIAFLPILFVPVAFFITIARYKIFDLYIVVRKSVLYTASIATLNVGAVVLMLVVINVLAHSQWDIPAIQLSESTVQIIRLSNLSPENREIAERGLLILTGAGCVGLLWFARRKSKQFIDRKFHRGSYDYRKALERFSQLTTHIADVPTLAQTVVDDVTDIMHVRGAVFALRIDGRFSIQQARGIDVTPEMEDALMVDGDWQAALRDRGTSQAANNIRADVLELSSVEFLTPVIINGEMQAMLLLGPKLSETNYTREDVELLDALAINVADALLTMQYFETAKEQVRLKRELEIARRIQLSSLPTQIPQFPGIDIAAVSLPAHEVGGDFYDFLTRHDAITAIIGDVSGKGTSAALYLARIQGILRAIDTYEPSMWELFVRLNTQFFDATERNAYLTLGAVRINLFSREAVSLRAGHVPMIRYVSTTRSAELKKPDGIGIGLDINMFGEHLKEERIQTSPGDVLILLTDGCSEAFDSDGNEFGLKRLCGLTEQYATHTAAEILNALMSAIREFSLDTTQHDDQTMVVLKFE